MSHYLINCSNVSKNYYLGNVLVPALKEINLHIKRGEYIAILGPSGSGKSTLMNILGCLDHPDTGSYLLDNQDVSHLARNQLAEIRNRKIGFIFQNFNLLNYATALDNVALPLVYRGMDFNTRQTRAINMLTNVGLAERMQHLPNELSGGQRQRIAIARALVAEPDLLLADEPTGNLDSKTGDEIIRLFESFTAMGKTVIIVTHDLNLAQRARRIVQIHDGMIAEDSG